VLNTQLFDAIDVCSNDNAVTGNTVFNAAESGIHLDSTCGTTGLNNVVLNNTVNESCAGILEGAGGSSGLAVLNSFFNVINTTLTGNACTAPTPAAVAAGAAAVPLFHADSAGGGHPTAVR
jgi:parallel beta-helix repeat protein